MGRIVLHEFSADYTPDQGGIDLRRLQRAVAELMDTGAEALHRDGHDLDDVIFERFAVMRYLGRTETLTVSLEFLTDVERLLAPFHAAARNHFGQADPAQPVEIVGLKIEIVADPDAPVGGDKWR